MTCRIANTDKQQPIRLLGQRDGLGAPHLPCDGVLHVAPDLGELGQRVVGGELCAGHLRTGFCSH